MNDCVQNIERLNGRSISLHYKVCCRRETYTFRFISKYTNEKKFQIVKFLSNGLSCIQKIVDALYVDGVNCFCIISRWISGITANEFIVQNPTEINRIACSIANTMHTLHATEIKNLTKKHSSIAEFITYIENTQKHNTTHIPHMCSYLEFLRRNTDLKPYKEGVCHLDLHLANIVISRDMSSYLIDLENIEVSDIFRDFVFATTFYESDLEKDLWRTVLDCYFGKHIPDEFWFYNLIYSTVKMLQMCLFEIANNKDITVASKISNDFFRIYGKLHDPVPIHFKLGGTQP